MRKFTTVVKRVTIVEDVICDACGGLNVVYYGEPNYDVLDFDYATLKPNEGYFVRTMGRI